jgi:outer membrane immunogenic protein
VWPRRYSYFVEFGYKSIVDELNSGELQMKKLLLALTAVAAFTGSASAADLGARPYTKAPPPVAPAYNWTGFYIFGGGGGGLSAADQHIVDTATGLPLTIDQRQGGSGWFGTVGAGYDWQFNTSWVFGIFGDGQFGSIRGTIQDPLLGISGTEKLQDSWAAGVRLGWLVAPNVLSYVNGGYSGAHFSGVNMLAVTSGLPVGVHTDKFNQNGWFVGGGFESNLDLLGFHAPGLFWKTEYRSAFYNRRTVDELFDGTNLPIGNSIRLNNWNQTISTSLVYRFNWTGPVVGGY